MKKLLLFFLLSTLFFSSCEKLWEWPGSDEESAPSETTDTPETANDEAYSYTAPYDAMSSLNRYTDLSNDVNSQMSYLESDLYYLEGSIIDYDTYGYNPYFSCYFDLYDYEALKYDTSHPVGLTESEADSLMAQAEEIFAVADETDRLCTELGKNITAQDYLDDDFAKALSFIDELYIQLDKYYELHNALGDELDSLYDVYDTWVLDPSDPVSVGHDNMNKDIDLAEKIFDFVDAAYDSDDLAEKSAELQGMYDELAASVEDHTSNSPDFDSYIDDYYTDFYDQMDEYYLPTTKRIIRTFQNNDFDALPTDYDDLLTNYNYLVDYFNYYIDASAY